jgi:hypothetical protein
MAFIRANTNSVSMRGLRDFPTGAFVVDAVLTCTVYDTNSLQVYESGGATAIPGASGLSMNYQSGSNGDYYATVAASVQLTAGTEVLVVITASNYGIRRMAVTTVEPS